ncbi:ligand-gated ion channel [Micractinium conductrix]|uniref:Ligand-gated ion channel n=1 Tax=Micractinium conductrix TaxID=554055 RepID=A0A2P6V6U4_9CHLO|nr:ligand-gated ion channel [Micractinium conductrix]|eukprot:PSC69798.1 ligand-gated ion channel [Micractinium conductrix]
MGRLNGGGGPAAAGAAAAALALLLLAAGAAAQQLTPFQGRNRPPAGGVDVHVSAVVDHLIEVDDAQYRFEVVLYILLTWRDARAKPAVQAATEAAYNSPSGCLYPCTTIYAWTNNSEAINLCCDTIWLPHLEMINVRGLSQDRVTRYGVRLGEGDEVGWWTHVQAQLYTPLQFCSFPFDKQYLSVQLQYGNKYPDDPVRFRPSATGTQLYYPATGDKLSGWRLRNVYIQPMDLQETDLIRAGGSTPSDPDDPWPLNPADPNAPAFRGFLWQNGMEIYIEVDRISSYYLIIAVVPVYINTCLALLVFSVNPRHLDTRLGIVVTLFLSLTALQFILAAGLPSSTTVVPTQQLILVSYGILALIGVCSIFVFEVVSLHRTRERQRRLKRAQRAFSTRWHSVASSLGSAAAAIAGMGERQAKHNGSKPGSRLPSATAGCNAGPARQQLPAQPLALTPAAPAGQQRQEGLETNDTFKGPQGGGMGVYTGSSESSASEEAGGQGAAATGNESSGGESSGGSSSAGSSSKGGLRARCAPAQPPPAAFLKLRVIKEEMRANQDYAMYVALRCDRWIFWTTILGFNLAVILILAIQSQMQPQPFAT